ncbi:hypothetical protein NDU88_002424 [Pleurodeles waltl]|uniref:Uncharacterized protein n=1 Tax=Pleurodeles waltl TaxID=8319 RepID=A0AAV7MML6_PLEWA|nr:hypothetical protein NDU88_002424 [Pleurodeles waltl]
MELKNRTWDESTKVEQETKDIRGKNSLHDVKVLDKESGEDVLDSYVESSVRVFHAFWSSCTRLDIRERGRRMVGTASAVVLFVCCPALFSE